MRIGRRSSLAVIAASGGPIGTHGSGQMNSRPLRAWPRIERFLDHDVWTDVSGAGVLPRSAIRILRVAIAAGRAAQERLFTCRVGHWSPLIPGPALNEESSHEARQYVRYADIRRSPGGIECDRRYISKARRPPENRTLPCPGRCDTRDGH